MVRVSKLVLYSALVALMLFAGVQFFWFLKTKKLHEQQFDNRITLILREVADGVLRSQKDFTSEIPPIRKSASNAFLVTMPSNLNYGQLDSMIRRAFTRHNIDGTFELALFNKSNDLVRGAIYRDLLRTAVPSISDSSAGACVDRTLEDPVTSFSITFPEKNAEVLASMDLWMFSGVTLSFLVVLFGVVFVDLSRQRKLAVMKNEFISNMTHELKSPITNIGMAGQVLRQSGELTAEKKQRYIDIIVEENDRLKTQVEQVLLTASFDESDFELLQRPIDLNKLIMNVTERFRLRVEQRAGNIFTNLRAKDPLITGDETHLTNALLNLLDNAEKYSPDKLQIEVTSEDKDDQVIITVRDAGMGIAPNAQSMVFDRFFRASPGNIHDVKGFGLGLSYVKKIIEGHKGLISVKSRMNEGSMFTIVLPKA